MLLSRNCSSCLQKRQAQETNHHARLTQWFRKTFLTLGRFMVACLGRAAMASIQLTSAQRRQLRGQLREAEDASYYRRLLALLALDEGDSVAEVAERLGVTRQSVYNWAH